MYRPTIGLEIHCQLNTRAKMFCSCSNNTQKDRANEALCPTCLGHPGSLPVANKEGIIKVIKAGKALNCDIADKTYFDRKNYFYPDLPKGYQISQHKHPICKDGHLSVGGKKIRIERIHLEEDTGSLVHEEESSLIDFNRAGTPLMELVTKPDISDGKQASDFAKELRLIFRYLNISSADMEKGQLRVEVNISVSESDKLGTKVEIKNLNSFKAVERAVDYEIDRQKKVLKEGGTIDQETRGWRDDISKTVSQRKKEEAHDYRYFPEPDLPIIDLREAPFEKDKLLIEEELPQEKRDRLKEQYNLDKPEVLINNRELADYFERVVDNVDGNKKEVAKISFNYIFSDLLGIMEDEIPVTEKNFSELISLIYNKEISSKIAKKVLAETIQSGRSPKKIIKEKGLEKIDDEEGLMKVVEGVIKENKEAVRDYKEGKEESLQFLMGQVMKKTKGSADPKKSIELIKKTIERG